MDRIFLIITSRTIQHLKRFGWAYKRMREGEKAEIIKNKTFEITYSISAL